MEHRRVIIDTSDAGTWRAALAPNASCRACAQHICGCPDALYAGVVPAPSVRASHSPMTSVEAQRDHAAR